MFEFYVTHETQKALKVHQFADFLLEMTPERPILAHSWRIFIDGSSNWRESGVGLIIDSEVGLTIEVSLRF